MGRFIILSGPSCVGKGPLCEALRRLYPELADPLRTVVLYNSRPPRPGEQDGVDYHFRAREQIEGFRGRDDFMVMEVRGDLQALDLAELNDRLASGDAFFEGNPFVGTALLECSIPDGTQRIHAFVSPLSREEILYLRDPQRRVDLPTYVADVMRRKLLRRTQHQKGDLSLRDLEEVERRANSAYGELKLAHRFDWVIPNHDGEDSENWDAFYYPVGDAWKALRALVDLLEGRPPTGGETWDPSLVP